MPRARSLVPLLLLMAFAALAAPPPRAWATAPDDAAPSRPRIGLALSGGGARGAAHVGVLRVLEENRIPIDFIAGTSMGALVGGMYASGLTPAQLDSVLNDIDWMAAFSDRIPRRDRSFRRKRDDDLYLVKNKPGLRGRRLVFPSGLLDGHEIDLLLKRLTLPVVSVRDFDSLPIPYRAVAADIVTGEAVVLDHGDLAMALRSSMAIPAAFAPREIDGRMLVDGGITDNLPIEVVRRMGADVIIAVDIAPPAQGREELGSVVSIAKQLAMLASDREKARQVAGLGPRDVLIRPDLGDITVASFARAPQAIPVGERAAREAVDRLQRYSVSPGEYDAWKAARAARVPAGGPPVVGAVRIVNDSRLGDDVIAARLAAPIGEPVDVEQLERSVDQVYGLELFESVYFDLQQSPGDDVLTVRARARSWGPNYLQGGVAVFDDFEGPNVNVAVAYSRTAVNRRNGEWRTGLQVGQEPAGWTEFHQPLDRSLRTFAHVELSAVERALNVFDSRGHKLSELGITQHGGALALGRELGTWGELRAGVLREGGRIRVRVGDPSAPETRYDAGEVFGQLFLDRLDDVAFPRRGGSLRVRGSAGLDALGSTVEYQQLLAEGRVAGTFGRTTALIGGVFGTTRDSDAPLESLFRLGGLGRLSGLQQDELPGQHAVLAQAFLHRRVVDFELLPVYAGLSAEYGNVFPTRSAMRLSDGIAAGSVFLGLDTLLGPLCLAYGRAERGRDNFYLTLGQPISAPRPGFVVR